MGGFHRNLLEILHDRSTLYSAIPAVRADLVKRALLSAHEIDVGIGSDIVEDVHALIDRIATADERVGGMSQPW